MNNIKYIYTYTHVQRRLETCSMRIHIHSCAEKIRNLQLANRLSSSYCNSWMDMYILVTEVEPETVMDHC